MVLTSDHEFTWACDAMVLHTKKKWCDGKWNSWVMRPACYLEILSHETFTFKYKYD